MATLVIRSFPAALHARLKQTAAAHRRSVTQETIYLLEQALAGEATLGQKPAKGSYWAQRRFLPEYQALLKSGALSGGTDSSVMISEERETR
jgi:Antitoxin FitA-like, ribbon-helix-helix